MCGIVSEILRFENLVATISVELAGGDCGVGEAAPFDVTVGRGADSVAHVFGFEIAATGPRARKLAERAGAAGAFGVT